MVRVLACVGLVAAAGLAGCAGNLSPNNKDVPAVVGPAPRLNTTPMATALACLRSQVRPGRRDLRIGVNDFVDGTGVMEGGTQYSRAVSQRPDMMLVVALAQAGARLVNRSSVNVAEWEMKQAMEKKLGDGRKTVVENETVMFRPIRNGVILGSTDYVSGAVTELNWNISSGVAEAGAYSAGIGRRTYRISLAIDVMVTNTQTTEIVYAKSYKKQLVGFEINANFFRFVNQNSALQVVSLGNAAAATATQALELFNANLGEKQNEPTQVALRWVIELAAYDIMRKLTRAGAPCDTLLPRETYDDDVSPTKGAFPTKAAVAESKAPMGRDSKAASVGAPATEKPVVEARAEVPAPEQAKVTPSASTEESSAKGAAAVPEGLARLWHRLVAPEQAKVTPSASTEESSAKGAAAEPEASMEQDSKAASISAPATEKPVVEARVEVAPPKQAAAKPSASAEKSSGNARPLDRRAVTSPKKVAVASKNSIAQNSKAAGVKATAIEKRIVEAHAAVAALKPAEANPSASTEKSGENAQPEAKSSNGGARVQWMSGSVPVLAPEFSQAGRAGDVQ